MFGRAMTIAWPKQKYKTGDIFITPLGNKLIVADPGGRGQSIPWDLREIPLPPDRYQCIFGDKLEYFTESFLDLCKKVEGV